MSRQRKSKYHKQKTTDRSKPDLLHQVNSFLSQAFTKTQKTANLSAKTIAGTTSNITYVVGKGTTSNFNFLIDKLSSLVSGTEISEEQRRTALEIIKAGKDNGIDEMEIEVDQIVGMKLISDNEIFKSNAVIGGAGKMTIKIKYK
jgi:hypothetical protein